jgi:hypothetical protein
MGGLYFMWIPPVGPEEGDSVEDGLDVGDAVRPTIGEYSKKTATLGDLPVDVEIVNARDASPVSIWVVDVLHVVRALSLVARDHRLWKEGERNALKIDEAMICT